MAPSIHAAVSGYRGGVMSSLSALTAVLPMDVPQGWDDPPEVNTLTAVLLLGGLPLLLFIAITVSVYLPSLIRGDRITPGQPPVEDQWLGGPRTGTAELKGREAEDADAG